MRRLLLLLVLLPAAAAADALVFQQPLPAIGKGYAGPITVRVKAADGTPADVSSSTGTLKVYRVAPVAGTGGTLLFEKSLSPGSGGLMSATLTATDTQRPGTYYADVTVTTGATTDAWHGPVVVEGR